jgi:putative transposase
VLQIAPSGYRRYAAQQRNPELRCARVKRDDMLMPEIQRVWQANMQAYGADKVWHQLNREHELRGTCTVERLMRRMGLQGVQRDKTVRTTIPDPSVPCQSCACTSAETEKASRTFTETFFMLHHRSKGY